MSIKITKQKPLSGNIIKTHKKCHQQKQELSVIPGHFFFFVESVWKTKLNSKSLSNGTDSSLWSESCLS
jgi:hypothetical protein